MGRLFQRKSITNKLTMLMALSSGVALLLSSCAFIVNDVWMLRSSKVSQLTALAQVLASNSTAALAFQQFESAEELLASLKNRPGIKAAHVFDVDGQLFASFQRGSKASPPPALQPPVGHVFTDDGFLEVVVPIVEGDERLGTLQLRATLGDLQGQIEHYILIATGVMLVSLAVATLMGALLQRFITVPLLTLAATVKRVKDEGDYTIRVDSPSEDEIGELYNEFNAMLTRIDYADAALQRAHRDLQDANNQLEERVQQRTEELSGANDQLAYNENRVRAIVESAGDGIFTTNEEGILQTVNPALEAIFGYEAEQLIGQHVKQLMSEHAADKLAQRMNRFLESRDSTVLGDRHEVLGVRGDGSAFPMELTLREATFRNNLVFTGFVRDLTVIKEAQEQLQQMNAQLVEASRRAGMAEVANGVLHNVGNVLNSVNVAGALISELVRSSEVNDLVKVLEILAQHREDPAQLFLHDERGRDLIEYLLEAGDVLFDERQQLDEKISSLTKNIDHIKDIISTQQSYAGMAGVEQVVSMEELMDDALQINLGSLERHQIAVSREYEELPLVSVDKQKLLQILINLISNAKHAIRDGRRNEGLLRLRILRDGLRVRLEVTDNGIGISAENMDKIFRHGFTTKRDGHGFGLHSAALAAKELGGSLSVHSDGTGKGATFSLELPLKCQEAVA